ncbi:COG3650 family protein [Pseudomonas helleri]|uniref:COG3650 family protein n=1 Tax=Pseudomonas helleri TaxID=1608996 RepID=UPI003FD1BBE5
MRAARSLVLVALLPVFAGCQLLNSKPVDSNAGLTRLQGELVSENGQLVFQPCVGQQRYVVSDGASTTLVQDATDMPVKPGKLFADIRGSFVSAKTPGEQGEVKLQQVYRLERSSAACQDPNFKQQTVHANGNGPAWEVQAGGKGLILKREGQQDLALPYVEEQIGDSRFSLSTEANNQRIELWVAPQRCTDSVNGSVQHLSAELRVNGQVQRGCGYFGGARND